MKTPPCLPLAACALSLLALACDAQTTPEYPGRTLLTIAGSVTGASPDKQVVPALAFYGKPDYAHQMPERFNLQDADVQGQFPSEFTLRLFDAPPAESLAPGDAAYMPTGVSATIVAVTVDHPALVVNPFRENMQSTDASGNFVEETKYHATLSGFERSSDDDVVYSETRTCDAHMQNCTTTSTGDRLAAHPIERYLRGVVSNYSILYLADPASARSVLGWALGGPLSAGYHLVSHRSATDAENARAKACWVPAETRALARFNADHGTSISASDANRTDRAEWLGDWVDAVVSLDCPRGEGVVMTRVPDGVDHPVTLEIANDPSLLHPIGFVGFGF